MSRLTVQDLMPGLSRPNELILPNTPKIELTGLASPELYESLEIDLESMIEDIINNGNRVPPDLRIDDRDLKEFPNFYSFCFDKQGMDQAPFARQLAVATHLLAEFCPRKSCTKPAFFNIQNIPVDYPAKDFPDKVTFLEYGKCPKCGATKSELHASGELNIYQGLVGVAGQRSGKSALLGLIAPYLMHKWLKLQKPVQALNLMKNSILIGTFVGLTYQKSVELLWQPVHNAISMSPWFTQYHALLDHYGEKYDTELYRFKDTFLNYNFRGLYFHPSGPNKRTLRGATRCLSVIDELGWFPHGEENEAMERASANEVFVSLERSLKTVQKSSMLQLESGFDNIPMAFNCAISSPSSYMDKIMSLLRTYEGSPEMYTYHLPTWEMNPLFKKKDFAKEYRDDPIKAERDYGAQPPMSENPWMSDLDAVKASMTGKRARIKYRYAHAESNSGHRHRFVKILGMTRPEPCMPTILSLDAGYANNSLGIAIGQPNGGADAAIIQAVLEVAPKKGQNVINYTQITRNLLYPLIKEFNVRLVVADRWQSIKLLQDIEDEFPDVRTIQYTMTGDDFGYIYDCFMDEESQIIQLPKPELSYDEIANVDLENYPHCFKYQPASHLFHQFMTATLTNRGIVDKGAGYTDDVLRAVCLNLAHCFDEDVIDEYDLLNNNHAQQRSSVVGTKVGKSITSSSIGAKGSAGGSGSSSRMGARG